MSCNRGRVSTEDQRATKALDLKSKGGRHRGGHAAKCVAVSTTPIPQACGGWGATGWGAPVWEATWWEARGWGAAEWEAPKSSRSSKSKGDRQGCMTTTEWMAAEVSQRPPRASKSSKGSKGKDTDGRQVDVPAAKWGSLIGKAGEHLMSLQKEFGVQIRVPQRGAPVGSMVMIFGPSDACDACEKHLHQWSLASESSPNGESSRKVDIPASQWGAIIGKGGANLRSLQEEFGVQIRVPRPGDPAGSMVTISGSPDACAECERRLRTSPTSRATSVKTAQLVPASPSEATTELNDKDVFTLRIVSAITGNAICTMAADRYWRGTQVKAAIQKATRIPCIQHKLLTRGQEFGDYDVLDDHIGEENDPVGDSFDLMFIRLNPTRKLYWKIGLSDAHSKLHDLAVDSKPLRLVRPYFHVKLLQYPSPSNCVDGDAVSDEDFLRRESTIQQLAGDEIEVRVVAVADIDSCFVGRVELPDHVRCSTGPEAYVVLCEADSCVAEEEDIELLDLFGLERRGRLTPRLPRATWKTLRQPVAVQGTVELKATWPAGRDPQFFDPSRAPSISNLMEKSTRRLQGDDVLGVHQLGFYPRGPHGLSAAITDGTWVCVKQHSSMGCAIILFKVQQHRELLIARYSSVSLRFCGVTIDLKKHMEKQADGTVLEVASCAFAGWKRCRELSARRLVALFDHLCECC